MQNLTNTDDLFIGIPSQIGWLIMDQFSVLTNFSISTHESVDDVQYSIMLH